MNTDDYDWKYCTPCDGTGCPVCKFKGIVYYDENDNPVTEEDFIDRQEEE